MINEHPHLTKDHVVSTRDGYRARALCLADGYPAEVDIDINTHTRMYSAASLNVFDPVSMSWVGVFSMQSELLRDLPTLGDTPAAINELNQLAAHLRNMGDIILATANRTHDHRLANAEVIRQVAVAQHFREQREAQELLDSPTIANGEFVTETGDGQPIPVLIIPTEDEPVASEADLDALRAKLAGDA